MRRLGKYKGMFLHGCNILKNVSKGTISLLLALIVTPLMGLTCLLVESVRYQDVIEMMIEIDSLSSLATLGNYDEFINKRFGLLSVSQKEQLQTTYEKYFDKNSANYQNDFTKKSLTVTGEFSLSDVDVLKQQILEYSEISAYVQLLCEAFDIHELLQKIEESLGLKNISDDMALMGDAAELARYLADVVKAIDAARDYRDGEYASAINEYNEKYDIFKLYLSDYISALNNCDASDIYNDPDVVHAYELLTKDYYDSQLYQYITSPRTQYKKEIGDLQVAVTDMGTKIRAIEIAAKNARTAAVKMRSDQKKDAGAADFVLTAFDTLEPLTNIMFAAGIDDQVVNMNGKLTTLYQNVDGLKKDTFNKSSSSSESSFKSTYYYEPATWNLAFSQIMSAKEAVEKLTNSDTAADSATSLIDLVTSLMDMTGIYDPSLDCVVGPFYNDVMQQISGYLFADSISRLMKAIDRCIHPSNFLDVLLGIAELLLALVEFLGAIVTWVGETLVNFASGVLKGPEGWVNGMLLASYAAYNFPNRTTYSNPVGLTLSGFKYYDEIYLGICGGVATPSGIVTTLNSMGTVMKGNDTPKDLTFKGAEGEYLLCGSNNEYKNQIAAFFNIFMFRLCLNIGPCFASSEVKAEAAFAGQFSPVIIVLIAMGESLLDAFILANGGKEYMIKKTLYLTPSGALPLSEDLLAISGLAGAHKVDQTIEKFKNRGEFKNTLADDPGKKKGVVPLYMDYSEHLMWLLLLGTNQDVLLARIQNLVALEGNAYHTTYDGYSYDITKAYTYIHTDFSYTLNPMLDFSSLTDNGLNVTGKVIHQERYLGY